MMKNTDRSFADWVIASRPWSFTASLIPVIAITAYLFFWSRSCGVACDWWNALLALPMLMCMQAAGNLIGDYYDHVRKVDLEGSLNGVRHIQSGKFTPKEVLHYGYAMLGVAVALGLVILMRSSWSAIWIGAVGVLLVCFYPWLKFHALGDLDVLLGYALLPALGVSYVVTGQYLWNTLLLSLPFGALTVAILHANNTRDILNDSRAGISTLCISIGGVVSKRVYVAELVSAYVLVLLFFAIGWLPVASLATLLTLPLAVRNIKMMANAEPLAEEPIAVLDKLTAQLQLTFGLLFTVSFVISALI